MDYCDEINDIIICVLNNLPEKIKKKDLFTRENVNDILLEYTLDIHDIILDEIMDRIEHHQMFYSVHFFYLSELPNEPAELNPAQVQSPVSLSAKPRRGPIT